MNIAEGGVVSHTWNRPLSNSYTAKLTGGKGGRRVVVAPLVGGGFQACGEQDISQARRFRLRSGSTGRCRSHLANWASMRPAATLAQSMVVLAVHEPA